MFERPTERNMVIIGTAGRKTKDFDDYAHLTPELFRQMSMIAMRLFLWHGAKTVTSGGAAWADHVAVDLCDHGAVDPEDTFLYLPAAYDGVRYVDEGYKSPGGIANYHHRRFSYKMGYDTCHQIGSTTCRTSYTPGANFFSRNKQVAESINNVPESFALAFTFGEGPYLEPVEHPPEATAAQAGLKDGGTANTWNQIKVPKFHCNLKRGV